jgi:hypothetical protein
MAIEAGDTVTCARCGATFTTEWSDEDALAEARETFTSAEVDAPQELICDDCFDEFMNWRRGQVS